MIRDTRIGVSVLTGFLGSGKTTLLNRVLTHTAHRNTLVIINELGEIGVDHTLVRTVSDQVMLLAGGCICCTVRGDLLNTLREMFLLALQKKVPRFTQVVIETTGLADAAPVIFSIKNDAFIAQRYRYDGCMAVVDALNIAYQMARFDEAARQLALADTVFVSKADVQTVPGHADAPDITPIKALIRTINPQVPIVILTPDLDIEANWARTAFHQGDPQHASHAGWGANAGRPLRLFGESASAGQPAPVRHTRVGHFVIDIGAWRRGAFTTALEAALQWLGPRALRIKGLIRFEGETGSTLFQVVHAHVYPTAVMPETSVGAWPDASGQLMCIVTGPRAAAVDNAAVDTAAVDTADTKETDAATLSISALEQRLRTRLAQP